MQNQYAGKLKDTIIFYTVAFSEIFLRGKPKLRLGSKTAEGVANWLFFVEFFYKFLNERIFEEKIAILERIFQNYNWKKKSLHPLVYVNSF